MTTKFRRDQHLVPNEVWQLNRINRQLKLLAEAKANVISMKKHLDNLALKIKDDIK